MGESMQGGGLNFSSPAAPPNLNPNRPTQGRAPATVRPGINPPKPAEVAKPAEATKAGDWPGIKAAAEAVKGSPMFVSGEKWEAVDQAGIVDPEKGKHRLGRIFHEDARDALFLARSVLPVAPAPVRRRLWAAPVPMDQGDTPKCVAFSTKGFLLAGPVFNASPSETTDKLYQQAQALDPWAGTEHDGSTVRAAMKALVGLGYASGYLWAFSAKDAANWLLQKGPMVFGTTWFNSMFNPDAASGFIKVDHASGVAGGHAYLIFGVDLDKVCPDGSKGAVAMLNSWGSSWGLRGMAWISLNDVQTLLAAQGEAACCAEVYKKG